MAIREYTLSINDYNNPKVFEGEDAIALLLIRLFLMNPGDIESHPDMGIGIYKNYRNMWMDNISELQIESEKQIAKYLPMLENVSVKTSKSSKDSKVTIIEIQVGDTIYSLLTNGNKLEVGLDEFLK